MILRLSSVSPGRGLPHGREWDTRQELRKQIWNFLQKTFGLCRDTDHVDGNFPWDFHWMTHLASATVCLSSWLPAPPPSSSCTWSSLGIEQKLANLCPFWLIFFKPYPAFLSGMWSFGILIVPTRNSTKETVLRKQYSGNRTKNSTQETVLKKQY